MEEASARAGLASSAAFEGGLTTTISRSEVEKALRMDEPPDLILDVTKVSEGQEPETRKISITWTQEDLERLLRDTTGETVTLTFDKETLWEALESDVEAHGLREKVVILAVVAATAAGGASAAMAASDPAGGTAATPTPAYGAPSSILAGSDVATETPSYGPSSSMLQGSAVAPDEGTITPAERTDAFLAADERAERFGQSPSTAPVAADDRVDRIVPGVDPTPSVVAPDDRTDRIVPTTGPDPGVIAPDDRVDRIVPTGDAGPSVVAPDDRAVRGVTPTPEPAPTASDGGITIEAPSPATVAGIAGAIALAITGAAFVARSRRAPGQPA